MTLFRNIYGIPLNLLVVSVFLSIKSLGVQGALGCATAALAVSSLCMNLLNAGVGTKKQPAAATA
jgi:MFS transporter, MFS domain-containing protein family, molybdate-anion transporter